MPKTVRQSMLEKGWEEKDIAKAEQILYSKETQQKHEDYLRKVNPLVYWMGLLIAIVGNMLLAVFLIPFFIILSSLQLLAVIATMGLVFGAMFNFLLRDIEHVDYKHHIIAGVFLPVLALITIFVVVNLSTVLAAIMKTPIHHNMWLISLIYVVAFTLPYAVYKVKDLKFDKEHDKRVAVIASAPKQAEPETSTQSNDFSSREESWKVYQQRKTMDQQKIHQNLTNKYQKYL